MLTLDYSAKSSTSLTLALTTRTVGYDTIDIQYSSRRDFAFAPSPLYSIPTAASAILSALNQDQNYFVRARERIAADPASVQPWTLPISVYLPVDVARSTAPQAIMVSPAVIVKPTAITRFVTNGTVTAGRPVDNLLTDSPLEQLWATTTSLDFETSGAPLDTFALLETNLPESATWSLKGASTQAGLAAGTTLQAATPFRASANMPGRPGYHGLMKLAAPVSYRWFRIEMTGDPPGGLRVLTYLVAGLARTAKNIAADKSESVLDYGSLERLRDGTPDRRFGFRGRRVEFEIALMTEAQWETQFHDLRRGGGFTEPMLVVPNMRTGAFLHDRILYGPLAQNRVQQPFTPRFTQQFTIESLI